MLPPWRTLILAVGPLWAGCGNDCVDMCQQMSIWVDECGVDWEVAFPKRGWQSVEDCYDEFWDAEPDREKTCSDDAEEWARRECY